MSALRQPMGRLGSVLRPLQLECHRAYSSSGCQAGQSRRAAQDKTRRLHLFQPA